MMYIKNTYLSILVSIAVIIATSCRNDNHETFAPQKNKAEMTKTDTIRFQIPDSILLGEVKDFAIMHDASFLFTDGKSILHSTPDGEFDYFVCKQGHGKNEYIEIGKLQTSEKYIYVWCDRTTRLIRYNLDMTESTKYDQINSAISSFIVCGDTIAYFYLNGESDDIVVSLSLKEETPVNYYGKKSDEDKCLQLLSQVGSLGTFDGDIIYSSPSRMVIHFIGKEKDVEFIDKDFQVKKISKEDYNKREPRLFFNYISNNSTIVSLSGTKDCLYMLTETGKYVMNKDRMDFNERNLNLFKLNIDGNSEAFQYPIPSDALMYKMIDGKFYTILSTYDNSLILTRTVL